MRHVEITEDGVTLDGLPLTADNVPEGDVLFTYWPNGYRCIGRVGVQEAIGPGSGDTPTQERQGV